MSHSTSRLRLGAVVIAALLVVAGFAASRMASADAGTTLNTFVVDADNGTAGMQASITVPVGGSFTFAQVITSVTDPYNAYQSSVGYDPTKINVTSGTQILLAGGVSTACSGATFSNAPPAATYQGCAGDPGQFVSVTGATATYNATCVAPGTTPLHLILDGPPDNAGDAAGTNYAIAAGTYGATTTDASVTCVLPISKTHTGGASIPATATSSTTYTIHIGNPTTSSQFGQTVTDVVPAGVTVTGVSATPAALAFGGVCGNVGNNVGCTNLAVAPDPAGADITITATIPLSAAGSTICNHATIGTPPNTADSANDCFTVPPATLTVTKTAVGGPFQAGDPISWTIVITSTGQSTAAGVNFTDTPTDGLVGMSPLTGAPTDMPNGATQTITVSGNVSDPQPTDNTCNNSVSVTSSNAATVTASAAASCLSKNVRMVKSTDCNNAPTDSNGAVNLFLDNGGNKANPLASLTVCEWALNVGGDPQGVGAFEFDLAYNNHIFDVAVAGTNWLYPAGRVPNVVPNTGGCTATIVTENDVRFGCVSKDDPTVNTLPGCGSPDLDPGIAYNTDPVPGIGCGATANGVIATITVTPKSDLLKQITPGNSNGVISTLIDSGCEFADIWGHPLSAASTDWNGTGTPPVGIDNLGREIALPGIAAGGQVIDCGDLTITVRILEGDMNTDCSVDVTDDQMEASRYGSTFGSLLYDRWYDLEPALKDGDVDIKDLQKVFGRNGSNCGSPVPPQDPLPQPGDP